MGDERFDLTVEQPVDQALALGVHIVAARDERTKQEASALLGGDDRLLLRQPVQEGADGGVRPRLVFQRFPHVLDGQRTIRPPKDIHDLTLGSGDFHVRRHPGHEK